MIFRLNCFIILGSLAVFIACQTQDLFEVSYPFPQDNAPSSDKIALGKSLFFDKRLSLDGTVSCANCHNPEYAFTDRKSVSTGINGQLAERNAPSLLNSAFLQTVMFDAHLKTLELQVIVPLQEPTEMGHNMKILIPKLRAIPEYQAAAKKIFNRDFDAWVLTRSIAAFERSLISMNSPYDQYVKGDKKALNKSEQRGLKLFEEKLYCTSCHHAPHFTNHLAENNGLYQSYGNDKGRFRINLDSADIGFFKTPSLRNVELTYPYMHDGSLKTLDDVIDHYSHGGNHPKGQSKHIQSFNLSNIEREDLKAFLKSLTDTTYLTQFPRIP